MSKPDTSAMEAGEIARLLSYVVILLAAVGLHVSAAGIPASRFEVLGAGAFPKFVFALIEIVAVIAIIDALRKIPAAAYGQFASEASAWARRRYLVFVSLGALGLYILAIPQLGFAIASFCFVLGLQLVLMPRRPATVLLAVVVALVFSFGLAWLFADVFNIFLPRGKF